MIPVRVKADIRPPVTPEIYNITEFIAARIADDEAAAREAIEERRRVSQDGEQPDYYLMAWPDTGRPAVLVGGERVLREVEAKRAILADHQIKPAASPDPEDKDFGCQRCHFDSDEGVHGFGYCPTLLALAYIWNDHPDYQEAWRP